MTEPVFESLGGQYAIAGRPGVCIPVKNPGGYPEPGELRGQVVSIDGIRYDVLGVESFAIGRPYPDRLDFALLVEPAFDPVAFDQAARAALAPDIAAGLDGSGPGNALRKLLDEYEAPKWQQDMVESMAGGKITTVLPLRSGRRFVDQVMEATWGELERRMAFLESDCAEAMSLQRYDMLDRLRVVHFPVNLRAGMTPPPAVASSIEGLV